MRAPIVLGRWWIAAVIGSLSCDRGAEPPAVPPSGAIVVHQGAVWVDATRVTALPLNPPDGSRIEPALVEAIGAMSTPKDASVPLVVPADQPTEVLHDIFGALAAAERCCARWSTEVDGPGFELVPPSAGHEAHHSPPGWVKELRDEWIVVVGTDGDTLRGAVTLRPVPTLVGSIDAPVPDGAYDPRDPRVCGALLEGGDTACRPGVDQVIPRLQLGGAETCALPQVPTADAPKRWAGVLQALGPVAADAPVAYPPSAPLAGLWTVFTELQRNGARRFLLMMPPRDPEPPECAGNVPDAAALDAAHGVWIGSGALVEAVFTKGHAMHHGRMAHDDVKAALEAVQPQADACYAAARERDATASGRVSVGLTIGGDGALLVATLKVNDLDAAAGGCVLAAVRSATYPHGHGGQPMFAQQTFRFGGDAP